jgi:hypothetical protein
LLATNLSVDREVIDILLLILPEFVSILPLIVVVIFAHTLYLRLLLTSLLIYYINEYKF